MRRKILIRRKGQCLQLLQRLQLLRQACVCVEALPLFFRKKKAVQLFQLHRLNRFPINCSHALLLPQKVVNACFDHVD